MKFKSPVPKLQIMFKASSLPLTSLRTRSLHIILNVCNHFSGSSYEVILGANRLDSNEAGSQTLVSRSSIVHSGYNSNTINNDIAVVELPSAVATTSECLFWWIWRSHINLLKCTHKEVWLLWFDLLYHHTLKTEPSNFLMTTTNTSKMF
jgi:hypothetical protein